MGFTITLLPSLDTIASIEISSKAPLYLTSSFDISSLNLFSLLLIKNILPLGRIFIIFFVNWIF